MLTQEHALRLRHDDALFRAIFANDTHARAAEKRWSKKLLNDRLDRFVKQNGRRSVLDRASSECGFINEPYSRLLRSARIGVVAIERFN